MEASPTTQSTEHSRRRPWPWRAALLVFALFGVGILAAACGGVSSPGVASLGSTTTTTAPAASQGGSNSANYAQAVAYAQCMRAHGDPSFPDPNSQGDFISTNKDPIVFSSPQYVSGNKACQHLQGGQAIPAQVQRTLSQGLKYAQCMRTHGEPTFPDPVYTSGAVRQSANGIDTNSPQFQAANKACQHYETSGGS
jgi:hypothetical protein